MSCVNNMRVCCAIQFMQIIPEYIQPANQPNKMSLAVFHSRSSYLCIVPFVARSQFYPIKYEWNNHKLWFNLGFFHSVRRKGFMNRTTSIIIFSCWLSSSHSSHPSHTWNHECIKTDRMCCHWKWLSPHTHTLWEIRTTQISRGTKKFTTREMLTYPFSHINTHTHRNTTK